MELIPLQAEIEDLRQELEALKSVEKDMDRDLLLQAVKPSLISTAPKTLAIPTEATRSTLEREKQMLLMEIDNYRLIMEQRTNNIRQKITKVSTDSFEHRFLTDARFEKYQQQTVAIRRNRRIVLKTSSSHDSSAKAD